MNNALDIIAVMASQLLLRRQRSAWIRLVPKNLDDLVGVRRFAGDDIKILAYDFG